jgi:hypothetical protein
VNRIDAYRNADARLGGTIANIDSVWRNAIDHVALIVALWKHGHFRRDTTSTLEMAIRNFEWKLAAVDKAFSSMFKEPKKPGEYAKPNQFKYMWLHRALSKKLDDLEKAEKHLDHYRMLELMSGDQQNMVRAAAGQAKHNMNILSRDQAPLKVGHVPHSLLPKPGTRGLLEAGPAYSQRTANTYKPYSQPYDPYSQVHELEDGEDEEEYN